MALGVEAGSSGELMLSPARNLNSQLCVRLSCVASKLGQAQRCLCAIIVPTLVNRPPAQAQRRKSKSNYFMVLL